MLASKLDLRTFPSSLGPRLNDKSYTLKSIAGNNLFIKNNNVIYKTEGWDYRLEVIAVFDVNDNQKDDWIIWFADESKAGNYRSYQTLVIYDVENRKSVISAKNYP